MGPLDKLKSAILWCYRICHLLITGALLASVIIFPVYSGFITSFPSAIIHGNRSALFREIAILLLLTGFFALAFIPSFICWVQKPLKHYLENRRMQSPDPAPLITTSWRVKTINIIFTLILIFAVSFAVSFFREKMARSRIIEVFSVANEAKLSVDNYIETHNGQPPKALAETGFTNKQTNSIRSVIYDAENSSLKLVLGEFDKVKAGASLTFVKRDQGWDCFSSGIPPIHFMQIKCPEQIETITK
jgi:hypothetical protein